MMKLIFIHEFGKAFIPKRFRPDLRRYFLKAGITEVPYEMFGSLFYLSYLITFLIYFLYFWGYVSTQSGVIVFFSVFLIWVIIPMTLLALFMLMIYFYLDIKIFNRTRKMEEVLPDFLQEVSSNLKGGLSFEKALWLAIKPRFGILSNEIAIAAKKVMTGTDVDVALTEFAMKYDSPMLKRSVNLLIGEIVSGGKISDIIDRIVYDLKRTKALKDELSASVVTYMIFIAAIVIFIAPMLFALSFNLLMVIQKVTSLISSSAQAGTTTLPGMITSIGKNVVNKDDFILFSHLALGVIAIFSSMIVSIIEKGNIRSGVKYIPMFVFGSQVFYLLCLTLLTMLFNSLILF